MRQGLLFLVVVVVGTGCAKRHLITVQPPEHCSRIAAVNTALDYVPFAEISTSPHCGFSPSKSGKDERVLRLLPGMRIRVRHLPLYPIQQNRSAPALSEIEWIVPERELADSTAWTPTPHDYLFLSYLLAGRWRSSDEVDPINLICTNGDDCAKNAREALGSLEYNAYAEIPELKLGTAAQVRAWLVRKPGFEHGIEGEHALRLTLKGKTVVLFAGWTRWIGDEPVEVEMNSKLYRHPTKEAEGKPTPQGLPKVATGYAAVEVDVPVRLSTEYTSRYVPVYWSVADSEKAFNVTVDAVHRRKHHLSDTLLNRLQPSTTRADLERDEYFTIRLRRDRRLASRGVARGAKGFISALAPKNVADPVTSTLEEFKRQMLLAPGDVLQISRGRGVTDQPGLR